MTTDLRPPDLALEEPLPLPSADSGHVSTPASATPQIDAVVAELTEVLEWSIAERSRLGYFAALYLRVTLEVQRGVRAGEFQDGARMDRLDGLFAGRYLDALASPHINLDLGIAAVETLQGAPIESLQADFNKINAVLASLVDSVEDSLARVAPVMTVLDLFAGHTNEMLTEFSIEVARDGAWWFAENLAVSSESERAQLIATRDADIAELGLSVAKPGPLLALAILPFRLLEVSNPANITRSLAT